MITGPEVPVLQIIDRLFSLKIFLGDAIGLLFFAHSEAKLFNRKGSRLICWRLKITLNRESILIPLTKELLTRLGI